MADNPAAAEIAALGRLCGIAPEYGDNFGGRHLTSLDTVKALLSAMGVPWQEPERRQAELDRRRLGAWGRFLQPVHILAPDSPGKVYCYFLTPSAALPSPIKIQASVSAQSGPKLEWQEELNRSSAPAKGQPQIGVRHRLELGLPEKLPLGYYDLHLRVAAGNLAESGQTRLIVAPDRTYFPDCLAAGRRLWGLNLPLYALRSAGNWGSGDFSDLLAVTDWAAALGAAFVGVNPLHAPPPLPEADPSPYAPTSRLFYNLLYLDLDRVPEMALCPEALALVASPEFQASLDCLRAGPLIPYARVFGLKQRVLELLFQAFRDHHGLPEAPLSPRGREFAAFLRDRGDSLHAFGVFCALAHHFQQGDWRRWPREYHHPGTFAVPGFIREHQEEVRLYQYAQWLAADQLQQVSEAAHRGGLPFTLYQDLALGAGAGGFDTWAYPDLFAQDVASGAPPDAFSPKGQNWGIPPLIPEALRESGYQLFIDTIRANAPPGGMLRLDHVMGLFRLLWIPAGMAAAQGAYVHYPARELLAILALESVLRRTLIIGEDLGTVSPRVRRDLDRLGVFSYRVFYFERRPDGGFLPPESYPARAVAAVTTHDLPTLAGFWQERDLTCRRDANLYTDPHQAATDKAQRQQDRFQLVATLQGRGLLPNGVESRPEPGAPCPPQVRAGVLEYLAQSEAALLEVRLEEVFGWTDQQNLPGTREEHPNWRRRLPLALEEMTRNPETMKLAERLNKYRSNKI
jgi:4-alpha-glucanotransferase